MGWRMRVWGGFDKFVAEGRRLGRRNLDCIISTVVTITSQQSIFVDQRISLGPFRPCAQAYKALILCITLPMTTTVRRLVFWDPRLLVRS